MGYKPAVNRRVVGSSCTCTTSSNGTASGTKKRIKNQDKIAIGIGRAWNVREEKGIPRCRERIAEARSASGLRFARFAGIETVHPEEALQQNL
jgi:hypothetical protein